MPVKRRPLPRTVSLPFWKGLQHGSIALQHCCNDWIFYPRVLCPRCGTADPPWRAYEGRPTLYSFTVAHAPVSLDFAEDGPALLAIVALSPSVHLPSTIVDCGPEALAIGMPLEPVFDRESFAPLVCLRFRPALVLPG
jgi:uncharacterized OB-fold protein